MNPVGPWANSVVTAEALVAVLGFAVATGLMFARFARPTARVLFSDVAVMGRFQGQPALLFRIANQRGNQVVDARLRLTLLRNERFEDGTSMRLFHELPLRRNTTPVFALTWTAMHLLDASSPLYGASPESLLDDNSEIIVSLIGIDGTLNQPVHALYSWVAEEIAWNACFEDVLERKADGALTIHFERFHDTMPLAPEASAEPAARDP